MIKQDKFNNDYESTQAYIEDKDGRVWQVIDENGEYDEVATQEAMKSDKQLLTR